MPAKRLWTLTIALVLTLFLAACGGDDNGDSDSDNASSGDGKELTVYSGRDEELVAPLLDEYEKDSGVKLNVRYGDTAELASTIVEEGANSPADVFFGQDAGALGTLQKDDLLSELPASVLDRVEERFRSTDGQWVGTSARARVIAYDKRKVKASEIPKSVMGLTKPKWKDQVGWVPTNASFQTFITAMRELKGDEATERWLKAMKANGAKSYEKNGLLRDAIASGEVELGLTNHYYLVEAVKEEGDDYPVGLALTKASDPGSLVNVAGAAVLKSTKNKEAADEFLEFLVGDRAQKFFVDETGEYATVEGEPNPPGVPPLSDLKQPNIDLSDLDGLQETLALIQKSGVL